VSGDVIFGDNVAYWKSKEMEIDEGEEHEAPNK